MAVYVKYMNIHQRMEQSGPMNTIEITNRDDQNFNLLYGHQRSALLDSLRGNAQLHMEAHTNMIAA